ncbi:MAG: BCCT family transporter [Deltaproteobacteria bacterium]|nr:BCCT family transporter [Deltaproteobacteria bacterium]
MPEKMTVLETKMQASCGKQIDHLVFWPPFAILLGCLALGLWNDQLFSATIQSAFDWVNDAFGWLYALTGSCSNN